MSKLFSISLSLVILIQSLGISIADIAQIDEFIEHAQFHSEQHGDNVLVFISKHYGELKASHEKEHQEEKEDHEQLPFQHQSHISLIPAFVLNTKIFNEIDGDNTIWEQEPLNNLANKGELMAFKHDGFWQPMDTLRDKNYLEELWSSNKAPWKLWS